MTSHVQFKLVFGVTTLTLRKENRYQALERARLQSLRCRHLVTLWAMQDGQELVVQSFLFGKPQRDKTPSSVVAAVAQDEFLHRFTGTTHAVKPSAPRPIWAHTKPRHIAF